MEIWSGAGPLPAPAAPQFVAAPNEAQIEFFEKRIRPVLVEQCYECHSAGAKKIKGGLVLDSPEGRIVRVRLEGIGFGFLVPVYFVVTGMTFDIDSLLTADGLGLAALFLALLLVARGASALLWLRELGARHTASLALLGATGLPLIVAIVGIGSEKGDISDGVGASLIGAGMISVLVYPFVATRLAGITFTAQDEAKEY